MNQQTADILQRLRASDGFLSGGELCREFGMTRSAVWKHISQLRGRGYTIEAVTGRGYRLGKSPDIPVAAEVSPLLSTSRFGRSLVFEETTDSTNRQAKMLARQGAAEGCVVVADRQTGGRGRMRREWVSPGGTNLYVSVILRPAVSPVRLPQIPLLAAAAIHQALAGFGGGFDTHIKWPNDIVAGGRKLCGVLCEMESEPDMAHFVIVGIGLNVNFRHIPDGLRDVATSMAICSGREYSRSAVLAAILNRFEPLYDEWLRSGDLGPLLPYLEEHAWLTGREVTVDRYSGSLTGRVTGLGGDGELLLRDADGRLHRVTSGEATIRK